MVELIKALVSFLFGGSEKPPRNPEGGTGSAETPEESQDGQEELQEKILEKSQDGEKKIEPKVKNDDPRLLDELRQLPEKNHELHGMLMDLCAYVHANFKKDVIITMIYRTQKEQDYLYRDSAKYKQRKFKSPHQFWHALDLRSWIYTKKERQEMVNFLNERGKAQNNYYAWTAKVHEVSSNGLHFHVQFVKNS